MCPEASLVALEEETGKRSVPFRTLGINIQFERELWFHVLGLRELQCFSDMALAFCQGPDFTVIYWRAIFFRDAVSRRNHLLSL